MEYTKEQIQNREINHFFKAYLTEDEFYTKASDLVGYYDSMEAVAAACQKYAEEEVDDMACFIVFEKKLSKITNRYYIVDEYYL